MRIKTAKVKNMIYLKGDTINSFAVKHNFSQQALSAWINKDYQPTPKNIKKLAEALGCPFEDLIEDEEQEIADPDATIKDALKVIQFLENTPVANYTPAIITVLRNVFISTLRNHYGIRMNVIDMISAKESKD